MVGSDFGEPTLPTRSKDSGGSSPRIGGTQVCRRRGARGGKTRNPGRLCGRVAGPRRGRRRKFAEVNGFAEGWNATDHTVSPASSAGAAVNTLPELLPLNDGSADDGSALNDGSADDGSAGDGSAGMAQQAMAQQAMMMGGMQMPLAGMPMGMPGMMFAQPSMPGPSVQQPPTSAPL